MGMKKAVMELNRSRIFSTIVSGLGYERVGLEIMREGVVIASFTSFNNDGHITQVKEGLHDPTFVTRIEQDIFEQITDPLEIEWMETHPLLAIKKYFRHVRMPFKIKLQIGSLFIRGLR